jgi:hypothetical protein
MSLDIEKRIEIFKSIIKSQHCQRNWDLTKSIPQEDLTLLVTAATHCPSKQNIAFYKIHVVTNRDLIAQIHNHTTGFAVRRDENNALVPTVKLGPEDPVEFIPNDQVLANVLFVFEDNTNLTLWSDHDKTKYAESYQMFYSIEHNDDPTGVKNKVMHYDRDVALGISSAYLALTAAIAGYSTGFCACMNQASIKDVLGLDNLPLLMVGVGFSDTTKIRNASQSMTDFVYPTKFKQPINVTYHE